MTITTDFSYRMASYDSCYSTHLSGHTLDLILAPAGSEYVKHVEALPIDSDMSDHALILFSLEVMRPHTVKKTYFPQLPQCRQ